MVTNGREQAIDLSNSIYYMEYRKSLRRYRGAYEPTRAGATWFMFVLLVLFWGFYGFSSSNTSFGVELKWVIEGVDQPLVVVTILWVLMMLILFHLVRHQVTYNIRESFYVTIGFMLAMLAVIIAQSVFPKNAQNYSILRGSVILVFILVQLIVFTVKWFQRQFLPLLHRNNSILTRLICKPVEPENKVVIQLENSQIKCQRMMYYDAVWRFVPKFLVPSKFLEYRGEVGPDNQPHGQGEWRDSDWHGETLSGRWEKGIPIGPFGSQERGSNSSFVCLRMIFWQNRMDKCDEISYFAHHVEPTVGLMSAECCISGVFFREYPLVQQVWGPVQQQSIAQSFPEIANGPQTEALLSDGLLGNCSQSSDFIEAGESPLGYCLRSLGDDTNSTSNNSLNGVLEAGNRGEALIFVHGYNCALTHATTSFGQFLALSNLPLHIKPIIFSWNALRDFAYIQAINQGTDDPQTTKSFIQLLRGLKKEGYKHIHILAHSMGIRVVMAALAQLEAVLGFDQGDNHVNLLKKDYSALFTHEETSFLDIKLETVTLLNPDYSLDDFVNGLGQRLTRLCPIVTIYGNKQDNALIYAAMSVGLFKYLQKLERKPLPKKQSSESQKDVFQSFKGQQKEPKHGWLWDPMLGKEISWIRQPQTGEHLDVDVIDTTFIQTNVHSMKHMYFNLNGDVLADLRDIITQKKRASQRARLEQVGESMFRFRVAPPHVKNKNA